MPPKIWDSPHQQYTINNWKKYGLICREGETYKGIYSFVRSVDNCQLCNIKFTDEIKNQRCMDHDHKTGYFRKVLCRKCNATYLLSDKKVNRRSKTGHKWITPTHSKSANGNIHVVFQYGRKGFKRKANKSLTKMICYSFIQLLKKPI